MQKRKLFQTTDGEVFTYESALQQTCVKYFRIMYKSIARLLLAIPNGSNVNAANRMRLVQEGLLPGAADLFLSVAGSNLNGLYIEMKTPIGVWSKEQRGFAIDVIGQGFGYVICRRYEDFESVVKSYLDGNYKQADIDMIDKQSGKKHGKV